MPRSWHSSTSYLSFIPTVWPQMSHTSPRAWLALPHRGTEHLMVAVWIGDKRRAAAAARLAQVMQPRELAALALPVADRILDELERRILAEIADRKDRLEHRLQAGILALRGKTAHLQEPLVGLPLDLDQVRNRNRRLDLREVLALAINVLGKAVHRWLTLADRNFEKLRR